MEWVDRLNVLVIGPGLGRDTKVQEVARSVIQQCRSKNKTMVIDGVCTLRFVTLMATRMVYGRLRMIQASLKDIQM